MKILSKMPVTICGLCFSVSSLAAQNEVTIGFADLKDYGDNFVGIEYKRYLSDVQAGKQPYLISPYLNKIDSVHVRYYGDNALDRYELGGEWFVDDQWVVNGRFRYGDYSERYSNREKYLTGDVDVGYFVTPEWQVGGGFLYEYEDGRIYEIEDGSVSGRHFSNSQTTGKVFGRYTNIRQESGWDIAIEALVNDSTRIELDARYFFNRRLSANVAYLTEVSGKDYSYQESDVVELTVDYWFTPGWSLQAGAGVYSKKSEFDLASLTLSTSVRF